MSTDLLDEPCVEVEEMAKRDGDCDEIADGLILEANLKRLGHSKVDISGVAERTGISRQRVSTLLNARRIMPETLERIAKGLGVSVKELQRKPKR